MDLELEGNEVPVGPFSADIVLRDANTGHLVVVDNLLETTDHDHLGKLITYAAGLEAHWAVLVVKAFRPEHRSALNWLNLIHPGFCAGWLFWFSVLWWSVFRAAYAASNWSGLRSSR